MSAAQHRGLEIYLRGESATSDSGINAHIASSNVTLPASLMPCVSCHGHDGKGIPEGGVTPADIRWKTLTKPYGVSQADGYQIPPYDRRSLVKAIGLGLNSAGGPLDDIMPRYQMNHGDMQDLLAYLTGLGDYRIIGSDANHLTIGVILPPHKAQATALQEILDAYFRDINNNGGIFQRKINLRYLTAPAQRTTQTLSQFKRALKDSEVFAFVASHIDGFEDVLVEYSKTRSVPIIGAFSRRPKVEFPLNRYIFYLLSGFKTQTLALSYFVKQHYANPVSGQAATRAVIITDSDSDETLVQQLLKRQNPLSATVIAIDINNIDRQLGTLQQQQINLVYLLVSSEMQPAFFQSATGQQWWPEVLLPAALMHPVVFQLDKNFDKRVLVSFPNLPVDYKPAGLDLYQRLLKENRLNQRTPNAQLSALAAALLLVEGLNNSGRDISPEKLISTLEGLYDFRTYLSPALSYGPNRRIGAAGAYVATLDLSNQSIVPVSDWLAVK